MQNLSDFDVAKFLAYLFFEYDKEITPDLVAFWREQLGDTSLDLAWEAARRLHKRKTFGEPKVQDVYEVSAEILLERRQAQIDARRKAEEDEKRNALPAPERETEEQRQANLMILRTWLKDILTVKGIN